MVLDQYFPPDIRVENEALSLVKAGHEVIILCYTNQSNGLLVENYKGIYLHKIPVYMPLIKKLRALTNTIINIYPFYWARYIRQLIKSEKIEVLHIHDLYMLGAAYLANKKHNLPVIADLHENYAEGIKNYKWSNSFFGKLLVSVPKWQHTEIEWCNKATQIITVIEEAKNRYMQMGIPAEKITVLPNYVDNSEFLSFKIDNKITDRFKNNFVLIYTGMFDKHRGLETIINAIPEIIKQIKNLMVIFVGKGAGQEELMQKIDALKVKDYICFEGFQDFSKLPSYIKTSDICLIPHLKTIHTDNTIPHKLFHYMLLEKPVVATNCNPIRRIIEEVQCGLIYESVNASQLAEHIIKLYKSKKLAQQMGKAAKKAVLEKYNWNNASKSILTLYGKMHK